MAYKIRDFLQRSDVSFEWAELANDQQARTEAGVDNRVDRMLKVFLARSPPAMRAMER